MYQQQKNNKPELTEVALIKLELYKKFSPHKEKFYEQERANGNKDKNLYEPDKLENSVKEIGLLNPIHLTDILDLLDGMERLKVAIKLGITHIPAFLHKIAEEDIPEFLTHLYITRVKSTVELYYEGLTIYNNLENRQGQRNDLTDEEKETKYERAARLLNSEVVKASTIRQFKELLDIHKTNPELKIIDKLNAGHKIGSLRKAFEEIKQGNVQQNDLILREILPDVMWKFYNGNCFKTYCGDSSYLEEVIPNFPNAKVQATITSNPYNNQRFYGGASGGHGNETTVEAVIENMRKVFTGVYKMTLDTGVCVINTNDTKLNGAYLNIPELIVAMMAQIGWFKIDVFIWRKTSVTLKGRYNEDKEPCGPNDCWEYIFVFAKDRTKYLEKYRHLKIPSDKPVDFIISGGRRNKDDSKTQQKLRVTKAYQPFLNFIEEDDFNSNVISTSTSSSYSRWLHLKYGREHPAVMEPSVPLLPILLYTDEADTVFDPYMGCGTTLRTAILMGRLGLGVDIEANNYKLTNRHLSDICKLMDPEFAKKIEGIYRDEVL